MRNIKLALLNIKKNFQNAKESAKLLIKDTLKSYEESGLALWLNGKFVGYSEDTFTPSEFELTEFLKEGGARMFNRYGIL